MAARTVSSVPKPYTLRDADRDVVALLVARAGDEVAYEVVRDELIGRTSTQAARELLQYALLSRAAMIPLEFVAGADGDSGPALSAAGHEQYCEVLSAGLRRLPAVLAAAFDQFSEADRTPATAGCPSGVLERDLPVAVWCVSQGDDSALAVAAEVGRSHLSVYAPLAARATWIDALVLVVAGQVAEVCAQRQVQQSAFLADWGLRSA